MLKRIVNARKGEGGFTLIEMLVVIVILAILAGIVIFSVTGLNNRGQDSACITDERTLRTAEEAFYANDPVTPVYTTEAGLVTAGLLVAESDLHNITFDPLNPGAYDVTDVGACL